jgi:hypothetical protein
MSLIDILSWILDNDASQYDDHYVPFAGHAYYIDAWTRQGFIAEAFSLGDFVAQEAA